MTSDHRATLEFATWAFAGVAAVSLANAALVATIIAALISATLGCIRVYDRLKYGPERGSGDD